MDWRLKISEALSSIFRKSSSANTPVAAGWDGCEAVSGDVTGDCVVDLSDYQVLASQWLETTCSRANDWCNWADITLDDGEVNLDDFDELAGGWLSSN